MSLVRQFLLMSAAVFLICMLIVGLWMAGRIERDVTQNTAIATALYLESFVAPLVQELAHSEILPGYRQESLDDLFARTSLGQRVVSFKIWREGGIIGYASRPELIGKALPATSKLREAWRGKVAAGFDDLNEEENQGERARGLPLLEIYVPIRQENSDRIIAVVEFYERADQLERDIFHAKVESWLIIGGVALVAVLALFGIVGRGNRIIEEQRRALQGRISELAAALSQNETLRGRVERASQRVAEINERYLRRLGSELHDGPAQLLGLALLRLDAIRPKPIPSNRWDAWSNSAEVDMIRNALTEALNEIRNISFGLSLPALDRLSMAEAIDLAVRTHTRRTETNVKTDIASDLGACETHAVKATAFRFVQEALNNATRHAGAQGLRVRACRERGMVLIEVSDSGPGFDYDKQTEGDRLGLLGMRERVESMGGSFTVASGDGHAGTSLRASLPLEPEALVDNS
jgi:signal transduction histidine kinase